MVAVGRRRVLGGLLGLAAIGGATACGASSPPPASPASPAPPTPAVPPAGPATGSAPVDAATALQALRDGNRRWSELHPEHPHESAAVRDQLRGGQHPFATVLCCVDSRVPPELVFDQGLGDLLTVRTAGHVLDDAVLGSLAFGAAELAVPLVVVLGHSSCGAVSAAVDAAEKGVDPPGHLADLVAAIRPALPPTGDRTQRVAAAVDEHVRRTVAVLRTGSDLAGEQGRRTAVAGGRYDLGTGVVSWLDTP